jgi:hypothetical protein
MTYSGIIEKASGRLRRAISGREHIKVRLEASMGLQGPSLLLLWLVSLRAFDTSRSSRSIFEIAF